MRRILAIDIETTGLDPAHDHIVEVGAVLYDAKLDMIAGGFHCLCKPHSDDWKLPTKLGKPVSSHLTKKLINRCGYDPFDSYQFLYFMACSSDYLLAHNVGFEESFLELNTMRHDDFKWIDTMKDYPFCKQGERWLSLEKLAKKHGVVNQQPHSAYWDAMTSLQIFRKYDVDAILESKLTEP